MELPSPHSLMSQWGSSMYCFLPLLSVLLCYSSTSRGGLLVAHWVLFLKLLVFETIWNYFLCVLTYYDLRLFRLRNNNLVSGGGKYQTLASSLNVACVWPLWHLLHVDCGSQKHVRGWTSFNPAAFIENGKNIDSHPLMTWYINLIDNTA